jgi:hypothetical protein
MYLLHTADVVVADIQLGDLDSHQSSTSSHNAIAGAVSISCLVVSGDVDVGVEVREDVVWKNVEVEVADLRADTTEIECLALTCYVTSPRSTRYKDPFICTYISHPPAYFLQSAPPLQDWPNGLIIMEGEGEREAIALFDGVVFTILPSDDITDEQQADVRVAAQTRSKDRIY